MGITYWIIAGVYLLVGIWSFFWIKRDAEFRTGPWVVLGILSIVLWPFTVFIWMLLRGEEHLTSLAAKQSHRDYQVYMRTKKDKDLFAYMPESSEKEKEERKATEAPSDAAIVNNKDEFFQDYNLENLISDGRWDEALATARSMRKVAIEMGEDDRACRYEECIRRIEETQREEKE